MDQTTTTNLTITKAESQAMRSILAPLQPIMEEAAPDQTLTEDDIFFNIALPLPTHLRTSLMEIVSVASLWRWIREMNQLECITDGQWHRMGDYTVLMVRFGIRDASVTSMQLAQSMRMAHWGPLHMCVMQLIPRVTLLSMGFLTRWNHTQQTSQGSGQPPTGNFT